MDFNQAVLAHSAWKKRLTSHINGKDQISPEVAAKDDQCDLGKWLIAEGKQHASLPAFQDLKAKHAKFHTVAASVIRSAKSCAPEKALALLSPNSEFTHASADCVNGLVALKKSLGQ